jgi:hypothetical protein
MPGQAYGTPRALAEREFLCRIETRRPCGDGIPMPGPMYATAPSRWLSGHSYALSKPGNLVGTVSPCPVRCMRPLQALVEWAFLCPIETRQPCREGIPMPGLYALPRHCDAAATGYCIRNRFALLKELSCALQEIA